MPVGEGSTGEEVSFYIVKGPLDPGLSICGSRTLSAVARSTATEVCEGLSADCTLLSLAYKQKNKKRTYGSYSGSAGKAFQLSGQVDGIKTLLIVFLVIGLVTCSKFQAQITCNVLLRIELIQKNGI